MNFFKFLSFLLITVLISSACQNQKTDKKSAQSVDDVIIEESKSMISDIPAPKSKEVINSLIEAKAGFIFDITNDVANSNKYLTQKQLALNLGVYTADLSYVAIYHKQEEIGLYIKAFTEIAERLKINSIDEDFMTRIDNNMENSDSINLLIDNAFLNANASLNKSDRSEIAMLILAGSWIEGMFIVEKTMEFATDIEPLWKILLLNVESLTMLNKIMALDSENENTREIHQSLLKIEDQFKLLINEGSNPEIRDELVKNIKELRSSIIK